MRLSVWDRIFGGLYSGTFFFEFGTRGKRNRGGWEGDEVFEKEEGWVRKEASFVSFCGELRDWSGERKGREGERDEGGKG